MSSDSHGAPPFPPLNDADGSVKSADAQATPDDSFAGCAVGLRKEQPAAYAARSAECRALIKSYDHEPTLEEEVREAAEALMGRESIIEVRIGDEAPEGKTILRILGSVQKPYGAGTNYETWYVVAVRDVY